jgi:hypothetical protein
MHLKIPSDEAIGQQLRVIAQAIAVIVVAFYIAGHTFGSAIHWLSLNLTRLPAHAIDQLTADHASAHPPVRHPNGNHRVSSRRSRKPQPKHSKSVGFKL